jgi:hypothetical protein
MRKLALIIGLVVTAWGASAQQSQLNIYVGPNFNDYAGGGLHIDYEIPMFDDNLTIGPSLGIGMVRYATLTEEGTTYYGNSLFFSPAVVGHYYFDWLIPDMDERFDVFAKAKLGIRYAGNGYPYQRMRMDLGLQAGGRYHFSDNASLYLALGYAWAPMHIGVTVKL